MMEVTLTCSECGSGIHVLPAVEAAIAKCDVCAHEAPVKFTNDHVEGVLKDCPCCERKDFYSQKDFNRKIGVTLFVIAAILSIWTYGVSFIVLYALDLFLFRKLSLVVVCYKCTTIFRNVANIKDIYGYNHEMNDRIVYSDHDFEGIQLEH
ncbi:hypothetical protein A9Q84_19550 [Halobacteriovorax marinus]|uniref:Uncharacterized protein n=1 Tax=Halobacteriovorax marinus TaxID=97084 RepID=A0A1Y5F354_9BACT|nr:hypothetical protein A9Q84_19550 [Halobacteriovorax marinus]